MKSVEEIEKMGLDELIAASSDESVSVPEGFMERVGRTVRTVEALTKDEDSSSIHGAAADRNPLRRRFISLISAAAAVTLVAGIGFSLTDNEPKDTFDDPQLAYAELEKAFAIISDGISKGVAMTEDSQRIIEKTSEIFE